MNRKALMICLSVFITAAGLFFIPASHLTAQDAGRPDLTLNGGKKGAVPFKHLLHQRVAGDCSICHKDFDKKPGALDKAKAAGKLKARQVMNKTCIGCHRTKKKAGEKSGPVGCNACHSG